MILKIDVDILGPCDKLYRMQMNLRLLLHTHSVCELGIESILTHLKGRYLFVKISLFDATFTTHILWASM